MAIKDQVTRARASLTKAEELYERLTRARLTQATLETFAHLINTLEALVEVEEERAANRPGSKKKTTKGDTDSGSDEADSSGS